jgi:signal transduction histidine kinase
MQARLLKLTEDNTQALIAVSHDLRTPIQRMRLRASMLGAADARDAMAQDLTEMEHFIDSALSYVRSGADEQPRLVDVAALLATVVDDTADQGVNVSYRGPGSFTLETRPTTLIRMINNVLDNARRYADRIEIHLSGQEGIMAEIRIEDDGPGIPPDRRLDAVQPFRKLDAVGSPPPRSGSKHGVGLGLAYVSRALEMQGGKLLLGKAALGGLVAILFIPATGL